MLVWRLDRAGRDPLSGIGGEFASGRWHLRGVRVVYASATLSLAVLEKLVHVTAAQFPTDLIAHAIELSADLAQMAWNADTLPADWRSAVAPISTQRAGTAWLREASRPAVLRVPSAIVPEESNYLLAPSRILAAHARVVRSAAFVFDPRLRPA
jgi:RES domain-containing protein